MTFSPAQKLASAYKALGLANKLKSNAHKARIMRNINVLRVQARKASFAAPSVAVVTHYRVRVTKGGLWANSYQH